MLKVLIADDEMIICQMLKKLIHWEEKGLSVEGIATNGIELYEMMKSVRPDIVITDIRMPGYDGLQIVKKGISLGLSADYIIMSGYKNFEYAHTALNLGVKHYLLKPIDAKELNDTLDQILKERNFLENAKKEKQEAEAIARSGKHKIRQHFLNSIVESVSNVDDRQALVQEDCEFTNGCFLTFFTKIDSEIPVTDIKSLLEIINYQIEKIMDIPSCEFINSHVQSGIITVVNYPVELRQCVHERIKDALKYCQKELDKFNNYHVTIGVGQEKNSMAEIRGSIQEAIEAVKCRLKKGVDIVIFWNALHYKNVSVENIFLPKYQSVMKNQVEILDAQGFVDVATEMYELVRKTINYSPLIFFSLIDRMTAMIKEVWTANQVAPQTIEELEQRIQMILDCNYEENMLLYTYDETVSRFFERVKEEKKNASQLPIRMARQYINENYSRAISLEEVAEAIGFSPAYLSTLFKKEIGINFSDYLTSCRMDAAKKLLKEESLSINEIAGKVGYSDSKYFSKIFNKVVGLKPSEYRKLYR
ncbi:two-component system response regulator YesN [Catenibacillus scindens]|uniref:Stage 0 sporulation protein A homolog n=1 Tax=Catenibacillus scindens TaxID=673271 RepID=A0A7W8M3P1_9FIRM|nr:helix-turn-helix domain-containing protein [Catenibacillus scindens]MBB5263288.1 two-component system response regulator YesN [Catenibacillus scindens]